jgi:TonB family protein
MFRRFQINPFDLLGQNELYPIAVHLPGVCEPNLTIAWNSFHHNFISELAAFFRWTRIPKGEPAGNIFVDCRIQRRMPYAALLAAALWHVVFFVIPWPRMPMAPKHVSALDNTELTWNGSIEDLPLLNVPKQSHKTATPKAGVDDPPARTTDAFHPRQRIFTDPSHPTHPRQTLVNTSAPLEPPKFLPVLPNMVQLASPAAPARPHLEISEQTLSKLRPKPVHKIATTAVPAPDVPNMEAHPADVSITQVADGPAKPRLEINAGSAPRVADRTQTGDMASAPEVATALPGATNGPTATIIALSAAPAPPSPTVEVPQGNLAARVAISPEGKGTGTGSASGNPSGTPGSGSGSNAGDTAGKSSIGISISGGNPKPNSGMSGSGGAGRLSLPKTQSIYKRPDTNSAIEDPPERTGPPNFAALVPGARPEQIFAAHRVYTMNVDMPNLNSVTGSWIIHFSELHLPGVARSPSQISAPGPLHKVDPKYPQDLIQEHVQGQVILYGVIRTDGSVDSIQLVRGLDKQLDANAIEAFGQWKFRPATKDGQPVALEAIVYIPFKGPERE